MKFDIDGLEVYFPYESLYPEQYEYMKELKKALDAKGHCMLEMPTGTGKTVSLIALITSYQRAHPTTGKLIYCTRTVPEMSQTVEELRKVITYTKSELEKEARAAREGKHPDDGEEDKKVVLPKARAELLGVCLSSRRNMCIHEKVIEHSDRERVDALCRTMTAPWIRQHHGSSPEAIEDACRSNKLCSFYETYQALDNNFPVSSGVYNLDDMRKLGKQEGICPYFLTRSIIKFADVVVFNYQYMLDPKVSKMVAEELTSNSIVVFDEAHNIDNVCIEALSVSFNRRSLQAASRNLTRLTGLLQETKRTDQQRLVEEYNKLVEGLTGSSPGESSEANATSGNTAATRKAGSSEQKGEDEAAMEIDDDGTAIQPTSSSTSQAVISTLPKIDPLQLDLHLATVSQDILNQAVPGSIRKAEHFLQLMSLIVKHLKMRLEVERVEKEMPSAFLHNLRTALSIETKPLRFAFTRLNLLLKTLQVADVDEFDPVCRVADFLTLVSTPAFKEGFLLILEPFDERTPHFIDPVLQFACLDASIAIKPVLDKFHSVVITSGTISPIDLYPKLLNLKTVVRKSLAMSIIRRSICPIIVTKGSDQNVITSQFNARDNPSVASNYGSLLLQLSQCVPDGMVCFFPSYQYMENIISEWHNSGLLQKILRHKLVFLETKDIVETTVALDNFRRACDCGRGAVFISIARGKVSEGIDFDRHYGRAVILCGVPFQYTRSHVLLARLEYLRKTFNIREDEFLAFDALRQAAQCVGRVIRNKLDYGLMIFADKRYASVSKKSKLPPWILQFLEDGHTNLSVDEAIAVCKNFLREIA